MRLYGETKGSEWQKRMAQQLTPKVRNLRSIGGLYATVCDCAAASPADAGHGIDPADAGQGIDPADAGHGFDPELRRRARDRSS